MNERGSERYRELIEDAKRIDHLCDDFERSWLAGERPKIEAYLDRVAEAERPKLLRELLQGELEAQLAKGESPDRDHYVQRFPECATWIERVLDLDSLSHGSETVEQTSELEPPIAIEGFRILKELSRGGQAVVYQAIQLSTKRKVALKVLSEGPFRGTENKRRFEREIELVGGLWHPGIVSIFDSGISHGRCYYAMEYIRGQTLTRYVRSEGLALPEVLRLFARVCDAVDYAHQQGVIHRDLKPSNILVDERGDPHVLDFGLAKIAGAEAGVQSLVSLTGQIVGTPAYMSPEQAAGRPDKVDMRSDVYALGVVLYELLTGQRPYDVAGAVRDVLHTIQHTQPKRPSLIGTVMNSEVETIVLKTLDKDKQRRYDTAGALRREVNRYLAGEPIEAKRDSALYVLRKTLRRYRAAATIGTAMLTIITASAVAMSYLYYRAEINAANELAARQKADEEAQRANAAAQKEAAARKEISQQLYISDIGSAADAWQNSDLTRMFNLLDPHRPGLHPNGFHGFEWYLLWEKYLSATRQTRLWHDSEIKAAIFTKNGKTLITMTEDAIWFWDIGTRQVITSLKEDSSPLMSLGLSPDGETLAAGHQSGSVILWDVGTRQRRRKLEGYMGGIARLAFSPDKKTLVAAGFGSRLKLWDVESGDPVHEEIEKPSSWVLSATFSRDSKQLIVGCQGIVYRWELTPPYPKIEIPHDQTNVRCVDISPDGKLLAIAGDESVVRFHDTAQDEQRTHMEGHLAPINCGAFSPDGRLFASGSDDRTVRLWDVETAQQIAVLRGHTHKVVSLGFSSDSKTLASGSGDNAVILWDINQSDPGRLKLHESAVQDLAFSQDGTKLASTGYGRHPSLVLWDVATESGESLIAGDLPSEAVDFSPINSNILVAGIGPDLHIWDLKKRESMPRETEDGYLAAVTFSPNGKWLASAGRGAIRIWDTATWTQILDTPLKGPTWIYTDLAFSPNSDLLASPTDRTGATLYDTKSWTAINMPIRHVWPIHDVAFSPDGKRLATVCQQGRIKLWDLSTFRLEFDLTGETSGLYCVAFSPDGKSLATGGFDSRLNIWKLNLNKPQLAATLRGHTSSIVRVKFSSDGRILASASKDGTVRLWRTVSDDQIAATIIKPTVGSQSDKPE